MRRRKIKLGDVYRIKLPNDQYVFGRTFEEYVLAIYNHRSFDPNDLPQEESYEFFVGVYKDLLQDGEWEIVDSRPFTCVEDTWAPRRYIYDSIYDTYSFYYKGEMVSGATKEQCRGLEAVAAWDREHVIDRLMGDDKWTKLVNKSFYTDEIN